MQSTHEFVMCELGGLEMEVDLPEEFATFSKEFGTPFVNDATVSWEFVCESLEAMLSAED